MQYSIKNIFKLSWPVMAGMVLQNLMGTFDLMFIGRLGTVEAAAASMSISAAGVIFLFSTLFGSGMLAIISRLYGQGDEKEAMRYTSASLINSLIMGLILTILGSIWINELLKVMYNIDGMVLSFAESYMETALLGTVFIFLNATYRSVLQGRGNTMTPLIIFGAANIINIILDPIFMFTFNMGIKGAALATVCSRGIAWLLIQHYVVKSLYKGSYFNVIKFLYLDMKHTVEIYKIGIWALLQQLSRPITGILMFRIVYMVGGEIGTAAFGFGGQLFSYTFIFLAGMSMAISITVGQALGKGEVDEVDETIKSGLKLCFYNLLIFSIPYVIFPEYIYRIFTSDPAVIEVGISYLRIIYFGLIFVIFQTTYSGVFNGAGDTYPPMVASLLSNVAFKLPVAYILASFFKMGPNGVWIAVSASVIIEAIIISVYFKQGRWKQKTIG